MKRQFVLDTLRQHTEDLRALGVRRLDVFGSVARDDATSASDLDVIADIDYGDRVGLNRSAHRRAIADLLTALTGIPSVDVLNYPLKPHHRETTSALQDAIQVF